MTPRTGQSDRQVFVKPVNQVQKFRFEINPVKVLIADYLDAEPAYAVNFNSANFRNFSMKLQAKFLKYVSFEVCKKKTIFEKIFLPLKDEL